MYKKQKCAHTHSISYYYYQHLHYYYSNDFKQTNNNKKTARGVIMNEWIKTNCRNIGFNHADNCTHTHTHTHKYTQHCTETFTFSLMNSFVRRYLSAKIHTQSNTEKTHTNGQEKKQKKHTQIKYSLSFVYFFFLCSDKLNWSLEITEIVHNE